jgi:glutathione S-transferase
MKLYYSSASPYARKVLVTAHEAGLDKRIELLPASVVPLKPEPTISKANPLAKVPTLITDDGEALYDSGVITEYLDTLNPGRKLIPPSGAARWRVKRLEALGDGMTDAGILCRYEITMRPPEKQSAEWMAGQTAKVNQALDLLEHEVASFGAEPDVGQIAVACSLGWLEFRKPCGEIRPGRPKLFAWFDAFSKRPSMAATVPKA